MYVPDKKITGDSNLNLSSVIDNMDIYNSKYLHLFMQLPTVGVYKITRYENRVDLISGDIFEGRDLSGLLLLYNNMNIEDLKIGKYLKIFSVSDLEQLYIKLNDIQERL